MYNGSVCCGPTVKNVITNSSIESVTLSRAPATIAGEITELSTACWICRSLSIASYQCVVRPVIGSPGVFDVSKENSTRNTIGMYRNAMIAPVRIASRLRVRRACRLTGIRSIGSIRSATSDDILDAQIAPEDHQEDRHEDRDDDRERGALRVLRAAEEVHDEVRDQAARGATDERRGEELA